MIAVDDQQLKEQLYEITNQKQIKTCSHFLVFCIDYHKLRVAAGLHGEQTPPFESTIDGYTVGVIDAIRENDRVSFCVVDRTRVIPRQFSTAYESVHLFGRIVVVGADEERLHALRLLIRKYSPEYAEIGEKYIAASFRRTVVLRFDIEHLAGKCKRIPPDAAGMRPLE